MEEIKYTPKEEIDGSANNMGLDYESKVTLLTSLAACLCFETFEIKTNVNGYAPLDDICLSVKQGNEEILYFFQLKHAARDTELENSFFIKKNIMSKPKFDLDRYYNKYMELYKKLNKKIIFIFYTNYTLYPENKKMHLFTQKLEDNDNFFNTINTSSKKTHILKYNQKKICDYDGVFIRNSYFFMNQEHNDNIHKSILKLLRNFEISEDLCKLIIDDLLIFFNNFCKTVENKPILTKHIILRILYFTCFYQRSYSFNKFKIVNNGNKFYYRPYLWEFIKTNKVIIKKQYRKNIKNMIINDKLIKNYENDIYLNILFKHSKSTYKQIINYFVACCHGTMPFLIKTKYYDEIQNIIRKFNEFLVIFIAKNDSPIISNIIVDENSLLFQETYYLPVSVENRTQCCIKDILNDKNDLKIVLNNTNISDFLNIYDRNQNEIINENVIELDRFIYKIVVDENVSINVGDDLLIILNFTHQKQDLLNYINLDISDDSLFLNEIELGEYNSNTKVIISENDDIDLRLHDSSRNIHYFRFEDDCFYWRGTIGKTGNLNFIKKDERKTLKLTEILNFFKYNQLLVFSGVPGIGKSILMRQISKIIPPHVFLLLINLREKEDTLNKLINDEGITCLQILRLLFTEQNSFYLNIFEIKIQQKNILVILDGYDEIAPKFVKVTNKIIHNILDENIKVILTTRSVLEKQVEEEFSTKALILKSFDLSEQKKYLKKYFSKNVNDLNCNIHDICKNTINKIKNNEIGDVSFNSVPLHLQIISDILLDLLKQNNFEFSDIKIDKLKIYEIFIEKKLGYLMEKTKILNIDEEEIKKYHQNFSLKEIFSNMSFETNIEESVKIFSDKLRRGAEKTGILIDDVNDIFIHRTIAEYFTASWLVDNFENDNFSKNICINEIVKSEYFVVFGFFNSLLFKNISVCNKIVLNKFNEITVEEVNETYKLTRNILHLLFLNLNQNKTEKAIDNKVGLFLKNILLENHEMLKQKDDFELFPIDYAKKLVETNELIITINVVALNLFFHFNQAFNLLEFLTCTNIKIINSEIKFESGIDILTFGFNNNSSNQINLIFLIKNYDPMKLNSDKLNCYKTGFDWLLLDCKENINYLQCLAMDVNSLNISQYLLNKNNNISSWKDNENNPMHYACEHISIKFINFFIINGAKLEQKNSKGFDCFDIITKNDNLLSFKEIFEKNGLFYHKFNKFQKYLIINDNKIFLNYLLENNCTSKELKIYNRLKKLSEELLVFKYFLKQEIYNEEGNTILHLIVLDERRKFPNQEMDNKNVLFLFKNVIEAKYDINIKNLKGLSPLNLAVVNNDTKMIILLIESKADIESFDTNNYTPLISAIFNKNLNALKILLENNANIEATTPGNPLTPLICAIMCENQDAIKSLLEYRVNIETVSRIGNYTPLLWAVYYGNVDAIKVLSENKANIEATDEDGRTALIFAVYTGNLDSIKILLKNKAYIEAIDKKGYTALKLAVEKGNVKAVKLLLNFGAKIIRDLNKFNVKNNNEISNLLINFSKTNTTK